MQKRKGIWFLWGTGVVALLILMRVFVSLGFFADSEYAPVFSPTHHNREVLSRQVSLRSDGSTTRETRSISACGDEVSYKIYIEKIGPFEVTIATPG